MRGRGEGMTDYTIRRNMLLRKMKTGNLTTEERLELRDILTKEREHKEKTNDIWGALIILGILYYLSKK